MYRLSKSRKVDKSSDINAKHVNKLLKIITDTAPVQDKYVINFDAAYPAVYKCKDSATRGLIGIFSGPGKDYMIYFDEAKSRRSKETIMMTKSCLRRFVLASKASTSAALLEHMDAIWGIADDVTDEEPMPGLGATTIENFTEESRTYAGSSGIRAEPEPLARRRACIFSATMNRVISCTRCAKKTTST